MPGELPPQTIDQNQIPQSAALAPVEAPAFSDQDAQEFLVRNNMGALANRPVIGHDGNPVPLYKAIGCTNARAAIEATITTLKGVLGEGVDLSPHMSNFVDELSKKAQSPEAIEAKKKET